MVYIEKHKFISKWIVESTKTNVAKIGTPIETIELYEKDGIPLVRASGKVLVDTMPIGYFWRTSLTLRWTQQEA
jgi:hypothetical protein